MRSARIHVDGVACAVNVVGTLVTRLPETFENRVAHCPRDSGFTQVWRLSRGLAHIQCVYNSTRARRHGHKPVVERLLHRSLLPPYAVERAGSPAIDMPFTGRRDYREPGASGNHGAVIIIATADGRVSNVAGGRVTLAVGP